MLRAIVFTQWPCPCRVLHNTPCMWGVVGVEWCGCEVWVRWCGCGVMRCGVMRCGVSVVGADGMSEGGVGEVWVRCG